MVDWNRVDTKFFIFTTIAGNAVCRAVVISNDSKHIVGVVGKSVEWTEFSGHLGADGV